MLTAIIIDDEKWVCELLKKVINWNELGIELIGVAKDGLIAYKMIFDKTPDIVITDICMPGMDGIALIEQVKESGLFINFIIISGYQNFEYAKSALKFGVEDYILKPIEEDDINNALKKLRDSILVNRKRQIKEQNMESQLLRSIDKLKNQYLYKILVEKEDNFLELEELNREYQMCFKHGLFQIIIFYFDSHLKNSNIKTIDLNDIASNFNFKKYCYEEIELIEKRKIICILNFSEDNYESINKKIKDVFCELKGSMKEKQIFLTIGIGSTEKQFSLLKDSFNNAMKAIQSRIILGIDKIIDISKFSFKDIEIRDIISIEQEKSFLCMVEVYNYQEIEMWLDALFSNVKLQIKIDPNLIFRIAYKIIDLFFSAINNPELYSEKKTILFDYIENSETLDEMHNHIIVFFEEILKYNFDVRKKLIRKPVELAKSYVSKHYAEQINLGDIAKYVYLNPSYFSELFKKEVGINFRNYISIYRMEIAKELLKELKYTVADVGKKVGYKDPKHFSKLFKKTVGIKPSEFKNLHL